MRDELLTNDKQNKLNSNEKNSINWFCLNIHTILAPINAKKTTYKYLTENAIKEQMWAESKLLKHFIASLTYVRYLVLFIRKINTE